MDEKHFRDQVEGRGSHPGQQDFPHHFQVVAAEMNRRLVRQQVKSLAAQNDLLKSQEGVAKSLRNATWVLSIATAVLAIATIVLAIKT